MQEKVYTSKVVNMERILYKATEKRKKEEKREDM